MARLVSQFAAAAIASRVVGWARANGVSMDDARSLLYSFTTIKSSMAFMHGMEDVLRAFDEHVAVSRALREQTR